MSRLADIYYNTTGIEQKIFKTANNALQIYTEANLEDLLSDANIDIGFFYDCEKVWGGNLKFIPLPKYLDMSDQALNYYYAKVPLRFPPPVVDPLCMIINILISRYCFCFDKSLELFSLQSLTSWNSVLF